MELAVVRWEGRDRPAEAWIRELLHGEGYAPFTWSDPPDASYEAHAHDRDESIWIVAGDITFAAGGREFRLAAGDRLMLPKDTVHTARAGQSGATYVVGQKI